MTDWGIERISDDEVVRMLLRAELDRRRLRPPHAQLGVAEGAPREVARAAFGHLRRRFRPDAYAKHGPEARALATEICELLELAYARIRGAATEPSLPSPPSSETQDALRTERRVAERERKAGPKPASIVVVDDDTSTASWLGDVLEYAGYQVVTVHNARDALAEIERDPNALLLTDLEMPGLNGWTLVAEAQRRWPSLRLGVVTAHTVGPRGVPAIRKPVAIDELLRFVSRCLQVPRAPGASPEQR